MRVYILWHEVCDPENGCRKDIHVIFLNREDAETRKKELIDQDIARVKKEAQNQRVTLESVEHLWRDYTESNLTIEGFPVELKSSKSRIIFHLKKLFPFDPEHKPDSEQLCARCGHPFYPSHTYRGNPSSCGYSGCRCRGFMVNLYEEIKARRKTSEWRNATDYWISMLFRKPWHIQDIMYSEAIKGLNKPCDLTNELKLRKASLVIGYPKENKPHLEADITQTLYHPSSKQFEIQVTNVVEKL